MTKKRIKRIKRTSAELYESGLMLLSEKDLQRIGKNIRENNVEDMFKFLEEREKNSSRFTTRTVVN